MDIDNRTTPKKDDLEIDFFIARFSMDLEILYLQHRKDFYQGTLVANSTLFALLIAHFEKLQSPTEVERTLFLYLGGLLLLGILLSGITLVRCLAQVRQYSQVRQLPGSLPPQYRHHKLISKDDDKKHWNIFHAFSFLAYTVYFVFLVTCVTILLWLFAKSSLNQSSSFYNNIILYVLDFHHFVQVVFVLYVLGFVCYFLFFIVKVFVADLIFKFKSNPE